MVTENYRFYRYIGEANRWKVNSLFLYIEEFEYRPVLKKLKNRDLNDPDFIDCVSAFPDKVFIIENSMFDKDFELDEKAGSMFKTKIWDK